MDDLGFNKISGAVLGTALGFLLLMKLPGVVMGHSGEEIAYKVGAIDAGSSNVEEIELPFPQADWVAAMDETKGAKVFKKCKSCHNAEPGGANGTGPALYGIVGNDVATYAGYSYSAALTGLEGNWTYEALDDYLTKPSKYAPGTKMNFVGLKKAEDRAAVIEYLRVSDPSPTPQPAAKSADVAMEDVGEDVMEKTAGETETMTKDVDVETMTKDVDTETMTKEDETEVMIKEPTE